MLETQGNGQPGEAFDDQRFAFNMEAGPIDYPDGHHVFAQRMGADGGLEKGAEISFYQSGSFNATIYPKDIQPVARMAPTVTWAPAPLESGLVERSAKPVTNNASV